MPQGKRIDNRNGDISCLSTEMLKAILAEDLNSESSEQLPPHTIDRIVALINERDNTIDQHKTVDAVAAWESFKNYPLIESGNEHAEFDPAGMPAHKVRKRSNRMHAFVISVATIAACFIFLFTGTIVARAAGFDVLEVFGRWTEDVFHFITPTSDSLKTEDGLDEASQMDGPYANLQATLVDWGIAKDLAPTWSPNGFMRSEIATASNDSGDKILYTFVGPEDRSFTLQIRRYNSPADIDTRYFEKDASNVSTYTANEMTFLVFFNLDTITATWSDKQSLVLKITGNIPEEDIKSIINSIGGVLP